MPVSSTNGVVSKNGNRRDGSLRALIRWFYTGGVLPLTQPQQYRGFADRLRRYEQLERQSAAQNREYQWSRLKKLLEHAYGTSPFYR